MTDGDLCEALEPQVGLAEKLEAPSTNTSTLTANLGRDSDALQDLMKRRRETCEEFESLPEGSKADVVATSDVVSTVAPLPSTVFESMPEGSKADVVATSDIIVDKGSALIFESVPEGSKADVVASSDLVVGGSSTLVFESVPESSKADVASSDLVVGGSSTLVFESVPESSKADVAASDLVVGESSTLVFESVPESSKADVVAASDMVVGQGSKLVFESVPESSTADALSGSSFVSSPSEDRKSRTSYGKIRHASNNELNSWMEQMRDRCEVMESTPELASADVTANDSPNGREQPTHEVVFSPPPRTSDHTISSDNSTRWHKRSRDELNDFMARMRDRCAVLESMPTATTADAKHEEIEVRATSSSVPSKERPARQPAVPKASSAPNTSSGVESSVEPVAVALDIASVRESLQEGSYLSRASRARLWKSQLGIPDVSEMEKLPMDEQVPQSLVDALGGEAGNEEILFDASEDAPGESMRQRLVAAFCEKYLAWAPCHQPGAGDAVRAHAGSFFGALAQLLRYHSPDAACSIESIAAAHALDLAAVMGAATDGLGLKDLIFKKRPFFRSLLFVCDCVVVEEEELLLLFVAAVRLGKLEIEHNSTLETVKAELCSTLSLEGLENSFCSLQQCVSDALAWLDATPLTLMSLLAGGHAGAQLITPMCTIAPDELLHHIYEKPSSTWRLVVVDARMTSSDLVLPICIRLGRTPHKQRRQVLRDMPYEESIHLCFMGDGIPLPGDDAFELCRHLLAVRRKHISVVEGGWSAVEALARSLKLDLMRAEPDPSVKQKQTSGFKQELKQELKQARAAARDAANEVAGQMAHATETAQRMWVGAGRALQKFSTNPIFGHAQKPTENASKKPPQNLDV